MQMCYSTTETCFLHCPAYERSLPQVGNGDSPTEVGFLSVARYIYPRVNHDCSKPQQKCAHYATI